MEAVCTYYGGYRWGRLADLAASPPSPGQKLCFRSFVKHLSRRSIPLAFQHLPVLGTVRNPYERYVSQYRFGTWKVVTDAFPGLAAHPDFPDVSFPDFVRVANEHLWHVDNPARYRSQSIGWQTASLMQWYARSEAVDPHRSHPQLDALTVRTSLEPMTFLHMDRLNQELYAAMESLGYKSRRKEFILKFPKVHPDPLKAAAKQTDPENDNSLSEGKRQATEYRRTLVEIPEPDVAPWQSYYDAELKSFVRDRERLLFELFPQWDV